MHHPQGCADFQPACRWANCLRGFQPLLPFQGYSFRAYSPLFICPIPKGFRTYSPFALSGLFLTGLQPFLECQIHSPGLVFQLQKNRSVSGAAWNDCLIFKNNQLIFIKHRGGGIETGTGCCIFGLLMASKCSSQHNIRNCLLYVACTIGFLKQRG